MYRMKTYIPPLVTRAMKLAEQMSYTQICSPETGRLLQLLASQLPSGVIGEIGTGCGVAAAWIVTALSPATSFFTVEEDPTRAATASALFEGLLNVRVVHGNWRDFISNWHFGLFYAGIDSPRLEDPELLVRSLRTGGLIVFDSLTPENMLPLELRSQPDPLREFWLTDSRLLSTEILVSPDEAIILATRVE